MFGQMRSGAWPAWPHASHDVCITASYVPATCSAATWHRLLHGSTRCMPWAQTRPGSVACCQGDAALAQAESARAGELAARSPPHARGLRPARSRRPEPGVSARAGGSQVARPLLHERDLYLAWSCKRSRAVCGARAVVGVVGRSHLRGTAYHLLQARLQPRSQRRYGRFRITHPTLPYAPGCAEGRAHSEPFSLSSAQL
jgi:hypothetical protein